MEIKITHSLSPETVQILSDLIKAIRPTTAATQTATEKPKNYMPFTEPDIVVPAEAAKAEAHQNDINIATIRSLVKDKADAGLKAEIKELLTEHGAANVSQLKPSAYTAFFQQLQTL